MKREILARVHKGRSKGLLSKELMAEGRHLADIREAFEELLGEGALVPFKSLVRRPSAKARQAALFGSEVAGKR